MAMTTQQIDDYIRQHYGYEAWALNIPELRAVLEKAVGPNGLTVDQNAMNGLVQATQWYKGNTNAMRQWVQLQGEDPATAQAQMAKATADVENEARGMGVTLNTQDLNALALNSIGYQWDKSMLDAALYAEQYRQTFSPGSGTQASTITGSGEERLLTGPQRTITGDPFSGQLSDYYSQVMQQADSYLIGIGPATAAKWALSIATGQMDPKFVQGQLIRSAMGKFPTYAEEIQAGMTPKDIFSGLQSDIARTLELSPDQVDFMTPQFSQVLQYRDPTTNKIRPMTSAEAINWARQQPQWQTTTQASQQTADVVKQLETSFGTAKYAA